MKCLGVDQSVFCSFHKASSDRRLQVEAGEYAVGMASCGRSSGMGAEMLVERHWVVACGFEVRIRHLVSRTRSMSLHEHDPRWGRKKLGARLVLRLQRVRRW